MSTNTILGCGDLPVGQYDETVTKDNTEDSPRSLLVRPSQIRTLVEVSPNSKDRVFTLFLIIAQKNTTQALLNQ